MLPNKIICYPELWNAGYNAMMLQISPNLPLKHRLFGNAFSLHLV